MNIYLKLFKNHNEYEEYISSETAVIPNVSHCIDEVEVHYKPLVETRVVAKYNVTSTSSPTALRTNYESNIFKSMEVDGVMLDRLVTGYTFDTVGEHTVKYELYDETKLGNQAPVFNSSKLVECIIPDSVTSISANAFNGCSSLTSIDIPSGVTSIGVGAFYYCTSLTSIDISDSVTTIGNNAFSYCSGLTSIRCNVTTAPTIQSNTFQNVNTSGTLTVPSGSSGYDVWMGTGDYYLGKYNWSKVEQ
jgi:hypothetical protein